jgi:hypothetical protein
VQQLLLLVNGLDLALLGVGPIIGQAAVGQETEGDAEGR